MAGDFENQVVMITGANGALGTSVAQRFYDAGANLALVVRRPETVEGLVPDRALVVEADVTEKASMQAAVDQIGAHYGRIDALVHTVGGYGGGKAGSRG